MTQSDSEKGKDTPKAPLVLAGEALHKLFSYDGSGSPGTELYIKPGLGQLLYDVQWKVMPLISGKKVDDVLPSLGNLSPLFPYLISLRRSRDDVALARIIVNTCPADMLREGLQSFYGPDCQELFSAAGIPESGPVSIETAIDVFPDLEAVVRLHNAVTPLTDNLYLTVFHHSFSLPQRRFLAGVTTQMLGPVAYGKKSDLPVSSKEPRAQLRALHDQAQRHGRFFARIGLKDFLEYNAAASDERLDTTSFQDFNAKYNAIKSNGA